MSMGDSTMRLTSKKLKQLIVEVMTEAIPRAEQKLNDFFKSMQTEEGASTIVIITAENPPAKVLDPVADVAEFDQVIPQVNDKKIQWDNTYQMSELEADLQDMNLDYIEVEGEYFGPETSFLVFNMSKEAGIELGKRYLQDAIVFGQKMRATNLADYEQGYSDPDYQNRDPESIMKQQTSGPKIYFDFDMINLKSNHKTGKGYSDRPSPITDYEVEETRNMIITGVNTQARTNLFSKAGGKKFVIPFYSPSSQHDAMSGDDLYNVRPV